MDFAAATAFSPPHQTGGAAQLASLSEAVTAGFFSHH